MRLLRALLRDRVATVGALLTIGVVLASVVGPGIAPFDPTEIHPSERLLGPGRSFLLGTDELGRDLLSRTLYGARASLVVAFIAVTLAGVAGVTAGLLAGYKRGYLDGVLMRLMDVVFAFPVIILALALVAVLGTGLENLILAITIIYIPTFARVARASTLVVAAEDYVEAARAVGVSDGRLMLAHILPNIAAPMIVQFTLSLAYAVLVEASLSFLGLGVQPPSPSLGGMLSSGKVYLEVSAWVTIVPGAAIVIAVLAFNLLGDGLRDAMDPRLMTRDS